MLLIEFPNNPSFTWGRRVVWTNFQDFRKSETGDYKRSCMSIEYPYVFNINFTTYKAQNSLQ